MFSNIWTTSTQTGQGLPLLVFIHGFLGSKESFRRFPLDLKEYIKADGGIAPKAPSIFSQSSNLFSTSASSAPSFDIENYDYPTTGDNDQRVSELVAWLRKHCGPNQNGVPPAYVVLLSHSMGGLLASDAATQL
ncbi:hypothetical protein HDU67_006026, partial [Dinochytrium kinnereticum]